MWPPEWWRSKCEEEGNQNVTPSLIVTLLLLSSPSLLSLSSFLSFLLSLSFLSPYLPSSLPPSSSLRFLKILQLLVQDSSGGDRALLPSVISFAMKQIYPIISKRPAPDVKGVLYELLFQLMLNNWR